MAVDVAAGSTWQRVDKGTEAHLDRLILQLHTEISIYFLQHGVLSLFSTALGDSWMRVSLTAIIRSARPPPNQRRAAAAAISRSKSSLPAACCHVAQHQRQSRAFSSTASREPEPEPATAATMAPKFELKTPKGTKDFAFPDINIRETIFATVSEVFRRHGAVTIDTPVFELKSILSNKYGEDSKYDSPSRAVAHLSVV